MTIIRILLIVFLCIAIVDDTYSAAVSDGVEDAIFNESLAAIKGHVGGGGPSCFISRAFEQGAELDRKCDAFKDYLKHAGVNTLYDTDDLLDGQSVDSFMEQIGATRFVVVLFTPKYKERSQIATSGVSAEVGHIVDRLRRGTTFYMPVVLAGTPLTSIPESLRPMEYLFRDVTNWNNRFEIVFDILGKMLKGVPQLPAIKAGFIREKAAIDAHKPAMAAMSDGLIGKAGTAPAPASPPAPPLARNPKAAGGAGAGGAHDRHDTDVRSVGRLVRDPALDRRMEDRFLDSLATMHRMLGGRGPTCFLSKTHPQGAELDRKCTAFYNYLTNAGVIAISLKEHLGPGGWAPSFIKSHIDANFVVVLFTPKYKARSQEEDSEVNEEVKLIRERLKGTSGFYIPVLLEGTAETSVPEGLKPRGSHYYDMTNWNERFDVVLSMLEDRLLKATLKAHLPQIREDFERDKAEIEAVPTAAAGGGRGDVDRKARKGLAGLSVGAVAPTAAGTFGEEDAWGGGGGRPMTTGGAGFGFSAVGGEFRSAGGAGGSAYGHSAGGLRGVDPSTWGGGFLGGMGFGVPTGGAPGLGGGYGAAGGAGSNAFGYSDDLGGAAAMSAPAGDFMEAARFSGKFSPAAGSSARGMAEAAEYKLIQDAFTTLAFPEGSMQDIMVGPPAHDALKTRADAGNHLAQGWLFNLIYTKRSPFKENVNGPWAQRLYELSMEWVLKSAGEENNAYSQTLLGSIYALGINVTANPDEAVKWRQKAAEQDNPLAQYDLGLMYWEGLAGADGKSKGAEWMKKSARQGFSGARKFLMKNKMLW